MTKKKADEPIVNVRAEPGSGIKHDKHAPASEADIAAATETIAETETESDDE